MAKSEGTLCAAHSAAARRAGAAAWTGGDGCVAHRCSGLSSAPLSVWRPLRNENVGGGAWTRGAQRPALANGGGVCEARSLQPIAPSSPRLSLALRALLTTLVVGSTLTASGCERSDNAAQRPHVEPRSSGQQVANEGAKPTGSALALGWGGFARSTIEPRWLQGDHTLVVRFLAAYEGAFRGVLVVDSEARYRVAMAPFASLGTAAIEVSLGGTTLTHPLTSSSPTAVGEAGKARWRQLAVRVAGGAATLYVDGELVGRLTAPLSGVGSELYFGRLRQSEAVQDQFYGLIDDVLVFDRPLGVDAIRSLARTAKLDAAAPGLVAAWTFDAVTLVPIGVRREVALHGGARLGPVSAARDAGTDTAALPRPALTTRWSLPFEPGQVWVVVQGNNSAPSHHDIGAFALDFVRVDPALVSHNPGLAPGGSHALTSGQPVLAAADGEVVARVDCFSEETPRTPGERALWAACGASRTRARAQPLASSTNPANRNLVCLRHAPGEHSCYVHLRAVDPRVQLGARVLRGERLGAAGRSGATTPHLHFAVSDESEPNRPGEFSDLVTIPFAFHDYFASDDVGRTYRHAATGVPRRGQWLVAGQAPR